MNISSQDERELEAALKKSLEETGGAEGEEQKKPESPKFKAFTGQGVSLGGGPEEKGGVDTDSELYKTLAAEYGDDPEMIQGIMMSMKANEIE